MATKTKAKKKEIIDLSRPDKISETELNNLQTTIRTMDRLTSDVGRIELQKYSVMTSIETVQKQIDGLREVFISTYGTDNVNIQTGELAYNETKEDGEVNS